MELRHLLYFKTVAEELHFRKAATKLFISQPPLSRQIKELEQALGATLFERNNKKVALTEAGKYFKQEVDRLFSQLEESKNLVKQIGGAVSGQLRIGYISSTYHLHLVQVLKEIADVYPFVKTKLFEVPTVKQIQALEEGKLDIGILRAPIQSEKLTVKSLFHDPFAVALPASAGQFNSQAALAKFLKQQAFIFFNQDYAPDYHRKLVEICQRMGFTPNIQHEANNIHSILRLVESGLGVSIVPLSLKSQSPWNIRDEKGLESSDLEDLNLSRPDLSRRGLQFYELKGLPITTEVVLAYKTPAVQPAVLWFVERYTNLFSQV